MEPTTAYALGATLLVSLVSLIGVATLSIQIEKMQRAMHLFIGLSAGALLGDAFIHLIPEALEKNADTTIFSLGVLGGIIVFFVLEKYLCWYDYHHVSHARCEPGEQCSIKPKGALGVLVITGDAIHNFLDGAIIAASYLVSPALGVATTIAVFLHEVPQEISDFALLIHSGYTRMQVLMWNFISALVAFLGVGTFLWFGETVENIEPLALAFTAGGFIYIAAVNLIPELKTSAHPGKSITEFFAVLVGIGIMFALLLIE